MTVDELIVTDFKYGIPMANIHKEKWVKYIDTTCIALEEVFNKQLDIFKSIHPMAMNEVDGVTDETFYNIFIITYSKKWDDIKYDEDGDDDGW